MNRFWSSTIRRGIVLAITLAHTVPTIAASTERIRGIQSDPKALQRAIDLGRQSTSFCSNCHGDSGVSAIPEVPTLASQNPAYLLEQMRKFERGERGDKFMQGLIKVLKDDERMNIALYYASVPLPAPARVENSEGARRGREIFEKKCVACHGSNARGNDAIPRLAGQKASYLRVSLERYKSGKGDRRDPQMSAVAAALNNDEISAVVAFLATLP